MYNELDNYLSSEFSVDYWSDEGINIAVTTVENFSEDDWKLLVINASEKSPDWQVKLANVLGDFTTENSVSILISLLGSSNDEVIEAAIDSIRGMTHLDVFKNTEVRKLISVKMDQLKDKNSLLTNLIINDLKEKLVDREK
ncbi:HEAT repeat domain-containing protein [Carnobacterium maltaromaticum]|uniref:HEAT repeat domain-containing protein n=1 Tax=Carnobacterium maltaromaticum TaxID=2751 RepID=UPI00295EBB51|nr:HEAT repeat domain-containing protein [Carnobacterium maltaromaticum]